jgi:hypothetical protein
MVNNDDNSNNKDNKCVCDMGTLMSLLVESFQLNKCGHLEMIPVANVESTVWRENICSLAVL